MSSPEQLGGFPVFDRLTVAQRALVAEVAREVTFTAGTRLFDEGQPASGCWLIRAGQVALETAVPGRGQVVVHTLGQGDVLGWSWLVPPHRWHFSATATGAVRAVQLETTRLLVLADADPALGYPLALGFFEILLGRLQSTRSRLLDLYGSPRER
ncbi:MAG TPA: cyclic nucleotide-binding domain-containing protein [Streptosporangiaceae bacterium]|nr:cyclic nucleotide-binding domain-containing protein [Streptosporangiaceae bacterium]